MTLLVLAIPVLDLRLGMPGEDTRPAESTQRLAYEQLAAGFGPGFNGPLLIAVEPRPGTDLSIAANTVRDRMREIPGVVAVTDPTLNEARDAAILTVVPATGPTEAETTALVNRIRGERGHAISDDANVEIAVTGATAILIDVSDKLDQALGPYLLVVGGLAILLLMLVFRSIIVPIKAALGFLLSVAATFGAVVAIFQWGWLAGPLGIASTGPIVSFLPIFMIGLIFGLAMDYEVFLVTRMREEFVHGADPSRAVAVGFEQGARVVFAAAVIMISVFAGFFLAPEPIIQSFGFALAFGVLVDAFVVRMTLVPALLSLLGRAAWWLPHWLDVILPNVDVEGERLRAALDGVPAQSVPVTAPTPVTAPVQVTAVAVTAVAVTAVAVTAVAVTVPHRAAVHGQVSAPDGVVPVGAVVTVIDMQGDQIGLAPVEADGSYRAELALDPDAVLVLVSAPGHRPRITTLRAPLGAARHDAVLEAADVTDQQPRRLAAPVVG